MGKIKCESHFSHPHPLTLISDVESPNSRCCSGCKLQASGMIYSCSICSFFLHEKCLEMPMSITHPFHKAHALSLLPQPAYAGGEFSCDACGERGAGFSYHCRPCGVDLHILCAAAPLSLTTACHPHKLSLAFASPYDTKNFVCDVCSGHGADHWLYRCAACGFDAYLKCAQAPAPAPAHPQYPSVGVPAMGMGMMNGQNDLALQAIVQMVQNNNAMAQAILAARGGYGGDRGLQQMMQVMSALNRGGVDMFGGGALDLLGGGGLDFLAGLGGLF